MSEFKWNGSLRGIFCIFLVMLFGGASSGEDGGGEYSFFETFTGDMWNLPGDGLDSARDTFFRMDNLTALLLAGGASVAMHNSSADRTLAHNFENHQVIDGFASETLNIVGGPGFHFAATGLWYAASINSGDEFNKDRAWTMMKALSVTGAATLGLKGIRNNRTPNGKSLAWPSGHTSSSFTVASVLDEFYGPKIGIPAYVGAGLVAYRMMDEGDHWASDVVFGATLGWIVGHSVAGKHKELEIAGFKVMPYTISNSGPIIGVNLYRRF